MRKIFPGQTSHEVGFHVDMREGRIEDVKAGFSTLKGLKKEQVKDDAQLADAIALLRSRVKQLDARALKPTHCA